MAAAAVAIQVLGTFVVATVFYAVTLHLAATFILAQASVFDALLVAPLTAAISVAVGLLTQTTIPEAAPIAVPLVAVPIEFLAIAWSYGLDGRTAALVTLGHIAVSVLLAASLIGLFGGL